MGSAAPYGTSVRDVGASAEDVTGRGTGVDDTGLGHKRTAVMSAVQRAKGSCKHSLKVPDSSAENSGACKNYEYARALLQEVGGIEIAAMAGAFMHAKKVRTTCSASVWDILIQHT